MKIDESDMRWDEIRKKIYFLGDSFYGWWNLHEFEEFIDALKERLEEIKDERISNE